MLRGIPLSIFIVFTILGLARTGGAQSPPLSFSETFSDGDPTDGNPVTWIAGQNPQWTRGVVDGSYRLEGEPSDGSGTSLVAGSEEFGDVSIHAIVKASADIVPPDWQFLSIVGRVNGFNAYYGGIDTGGYLEAGATRPFMPSPGVVMPDLIAAEVAIHMQLDIVGETLSFWAWSDEAGIAKTDEPQITWTNSMGRERGAVGIGLNANGLYGYVDVLRFDVATLAEPAIPGDVDFDGELTANDIDLIANAIRINFSPKTFDVNHDNLVGSDDHAYWVRDLRQTWLGDANLDSEFNSADLVMALAAGEYEDAVAGNSTWATGDWNGDGDFDSADLVMAFQDGGYEQGPRAIVASVPEPHSIALLFLGTAFLSSLRRHRPSATARESARVAF